jgi:4-carboxymuconolactone decarboxylase
MKSDPELRKQGLELMARLHGGQSGEALVSAVAHVCPDFAGMTFEWALAGIMTRPGLDLLTRELLLVAACTTLGHVQPQLRAHIDAARRLGATREQIVETILQMLFYAGGATVANALVIAGEVLDQPRQI